MEQQGLLGVMITVYDSLDETGRPTTFSAIRWMIDPQVELELEEAAAELAAAMGGTEEAGAASSGDTSSEGDSASGELLFNVIVHYV